jgi:cellulose synthase operon protein C
MTRTLLALCFLFAPLISEGAKKKSVQSKSPGTKSGVAPTKSTNPRRAAPSVSGPEKKDVAPGKQSGTRFFEGMGKTPEEEKLLQELSLAIETYEQESKEFQREIQLLIEKKYEEKRNTLGQSYEKAIRDLEVIERKERLDAIAQFEEFLLRYPDDPKYTPDVMFRLAELYYERSSDDHMVAMREYE